MITNNEPKDKSEPEQKKQRTSQTEAQNNPPPNPNFDLGFTIDDIPDIQNNPMQRKDLSQINNQNGILPAVQNMYLPVFNIHVNNYTFQSK